MRGFFEDFKIGDKLTTQARTVTEADIVNFAALSGDWFPLHTDAEYAKGTIFGERIAHGMLTLTIATGLMVRAGLLTPEAFIAFYGAEGVRFPNPVKIGDTIHLETEVVGKEEKRKGGLVTFKHTVKNQRGEEVAVLEMRILLAHTPKP